MLEFEGSNLWFDVRDLEKRVGLVVARVGSHPERVHNNVINLSKNAKKKD